MTRWLAVTCLLLTVGLSVAELGRSDSEAETEWDGTGNSWRNLPKDLRAFYVLGIYEGMKAASPSQNGVVDTLLVRAYTCVGGGRMTNGQVAAIVEKYVNDHPEQWHFAMTTLTLGALAESCTP